jgi:hypothetical protein
VYCLGYCDRSPAVLRADGAVRLTLQTLVCRASAA